MPYTFKKSAVMKASYVLFSVLITISIQANSQKKNELIDNLKLQIKDNEKEILSLDSNIKKLKLEIDQKIKNISFLDSSLAVLKVKMDSILNFEETFLSRPYVTIFNQKWAQNYLDVKSVKTFIPTILEANSTEQWIQAFDKNYPAYCYHVFDSLKIKGVLLNIPAIRLLRDTLEKSSGGWRIPNSKDVQILKSNLEKYKNQITEIITSSGTNQIKWAKNGTDIFGLDLVPLAYRRNKITEWYGKTFASFFYINENDTKITKTFNLFEIYEDTPNEIILSNIEEISNYGVFIRLLKNN